MAWALRSFHHSQEEIPPTINRKYPLSEFHVHGELTDEPNHSTCLAYTLADDCIIGGTQRRSAAGEIESGVCFADLLHWDVYGEKRVRHERSALHPIRNGEGFKSGSNPH